MSQQMDRAMAEGKVVGTEEEASFKRFKPYS